MKLADVVLIGFLCLTSGFLAGFRVNSWLLPQENPTPTPKPKQRKRRAEGGRHLTLVQPQKQQRS